MGARDTGPVDILVNNAAMLVAPQPTADVPEGVIDQALATNIKAVFLLTGLVAPAMAERGSGAIVNVGSDQVRAELDAITPIEPQPATTIQRRTFPYSPK